MISCATNKNTKNRNTKNRNNRGPLHCQRRLQKDLEIFQEDMQILCHLPFNEFQSIPQTRTSETPLTPSIPKNAKETPIPMPTPCTWQPAIPDPLSPIEPSWGPLKRYTEQFSFKTYNQVVSAAKWLFDHIRKTEGGPASCTVRALDRLNRPQPPYHHTN